MPNRYGSEQNGVKAYSIKFDNDIRRLNKIAHADLKQNLCHDMSSGKQITNILRHHDKSMDSYLK
jgi:hypothetical protein